MSGPLKGDHWVVGSATHGCWLGTYEAPKLKMFGSLINPGDVIYDIGANAGIYTLLGALRTGAKGEVHAFEPLPANVSFLSRHIELNEARNVSIHECAVSDRAGTAAFAVNGSRLQGRLSAEGSLEVKTAGLDQFVFQGKHRKPTLLKIDVEGGEVNVLLGASRVLAEVRPVVLLATHGTEIARQCRGLLKASSYDVAPLASDDSGSERLATARP